MSENWAGFLDYIKLKPSLQSHQRHHLLLVPEEKSVKAGEDNKYQEH